MITVRLIDNLEGFKSLEGIWNRLLEKSGSDHIQLTFDWLWLWWGHFGHGKDLFILVAEEGDSIIGLAPLYIGPGRRFFKGLIEFRTIAFIGSGFTDISDFIITRERERVLHAFFEFIKSNNDLWEEISLSQMSDSSLNFPIIKEITNGSGYNKSLNQVIACPFLSITCGFTEYYKTINKNWRYDLERNSRRLSKDGNVLNFKIEDCIDENLLHDIYQLNLNRNIKTERRSIFLEGKRYDFIRSITNEFNHKNHIKLFHLRHNDNLICYMLCFDYHNRIYFWNTSFDVKYFQYSVGKIIIKEALEYCFNNNYSLFDFMAGDEDYKFKWTATAYNNFHLVLQKKNMKSTIVRIYEKSVRFIRNK